MFFSVSSSILGRTVFVSHFARFSVFFAIFQALPCEFLIFLLCQFLLHIIQVLPCLCSIFHVFQWFLPYSRSYHISFSFSSFDIFLAIFQVLKWVCIPFHVFQFFQHILVPVMWISLFFFHFPVLSPYSRSYSVHFLFSTLFSFSRHIPGLTVCISFYTFYSFFGIFQVLQCSFLIFQVFQCFSPYFMSNNLCFSFSMIFSFLAIVQVLQCAFPFFHVFECFSPYSRPNSVCVSFSTFFSFLPIFQVKQCFCLIFHVFQFSCHIPCPRMWISYFPRFSVPSP